VRDERPDEDSLLAPNESTRVTDLKSQTLADSLPHMVWSTLPDGFHDYYNAHWYEFTGVPPGSTDGEGWNGMFHPDDQDRAWALWRQSLETGEPYEIEYRLRHRSGQYRWTLGRATAMRDADGKIVRWVGTCTDIDDAKRQAQELEILSRELSHRIKNIFAVISGLIGLSARQEPEAKGFADRLRKRISALARAHDFARPHSDQSRPHNVPQSLQGVLHEILSPYPALQDGRITISGADVGLDDRGATPIALLFHELATNATKYGALAAADGTVQIGIERDSNGITISWVEHGGPRIEGEPHHTGFGSKLVDLSLVDQMGGQIERDWRPEGLAMTIRLDPARLAR
jgi:PAS domain S-box-containing protein